VVFPLHGPEAVAADDTPCLWVAPVFTMGTIAPWGWLKFDHLQDFSE
jgi:hypothetical protein